MSQNIAEMLRSGQAELFHLDTGKTVAEVAAELIDEMQADINRLRSENSFLRTYGASLRGALRAVRESDDWDKLSAPIRTKVDMALAQLIP